MDNIKIDIVILSYAKDEKLLKSTIQTIDTLLNSENANNFTFNIIVIESNKSLAPYQFEHTTTIYPPLKFGFNKFLNIGIDMTSNDYICLCNNDLIFHEGWATSLMGFLKQLNIDRVVLSPFCETSHQKFSNLSEPKEGYFGYFAGYCFFTTRKTLDSIGRLDEKINFWYSDMDFINLMNKNNISHYLVPKAKVSHMVSQVTAGFSKIESLRYKHYPHIYFRYKWEDQNTFFYGIRLFKYMMKYMIYLIEDAFKKFSVK